jgi:hypothetical protein
MMNKGVAGLLSILILLIGGCVAVGQPSQSEVDFDFDGLNSKYGLSQDVTAYVVNRSDRAFYFYCTVEAQLQDQWREIMYSIDQPVPRMAIELKRIAPGERAAISWSADRRRFQSWGAGTYRLVVFVSETETPALSPLTFRSGSFVVESEL